MVSVGSLPVDGNTVFDFDSQAGVMHLLASIRGSDITAQQKSDLRDLVFLYTNGGKDQSVRLSLEQKISAYHVTPAPKKVSAAAVQSLPPQPTIGKYRVAPTFIPVQPSAPVAPAVSTSTTIPVFSAEPAWTPHQPPAPEPAPQPEPVVTSIPVAEVSPAMSEPVSQSEATVTVADVSVYLTRIREIKASVNEKVGNPVNLVDINNEVGREYMGALLDAMKKLNSGSSAASAMKRLEDSYAAVLKAIEAHDAGHPGIPEPAPISAPTPVVTSIPVAEVSPAMHEPAPMPVHEIPVVPPMPTPAPAPIIEEEPPVSTPVAPAGTPFKPVSQYTPTPEDVLPQPASDPVAASWSQEAPALRAVQQTSGFASLADLKKPHTLEDLQANASLKSASVASGDPLFSKEVDDGLEQLLSEWSIFKKSGIFGTGPKGKEHPLFKKIAPLHIPLLLAGRFEGATQEIKQSITDYMNGWRYEQGIIYQQGETFEHYLRRVIRHILDLQKGKTPA